MVCLTCSPTSIPQSLFLTDHPIQLLQIHFTNLWNILGNNIITSISNIWSVDGNIFNRCSPQLTVQIICYQILLSGMHAFFLKTLGEFPFSYCSTCSVWSIPLFSQQNNCSLFYIYIIWRRYMLKWYSETEQVLRMHPGRTVLWLWQCGVGLKLNIKSGIWEIDLGNFRRIQVNATLIQTK